jgi:hypothetical protein
VFPSGERAFYAHCLDKARTAGREWRDHAFALQVCSCGAWGVGQDSHLVLDFPQFIALLVWPTSIPK